MNGFDAICITECNMYSFLYLTQEFNTLSVSVTSTSVSTLPKLFKQGHEIWQSLPFCR